MKIRNFPERLSLCMNKRKINNTELAEMSGITTATISRYLNGLRQPTAENIVLLSDSLNVSADYLLGLCDVPEENALISAYSIASADDKRVIWAILEKYGDNT